ncbi:hypothetical protein WMY93_006981 [Mugilogobius chulae]|uniref:Integrase catalytic domain-containing protein n=1 Tax=Mugilogobius chulae TaxID=88201 RepID=A0AAW0PQ28_9GOBI
MLAESNIRLHKIASNASQVMNAFPQEERATDLKDLDLDVDPLPLQRSLGVSWNLENDSFTFRVGKDTKPFTRRGILSVVNSLYDPLGFAAPVTIQGKALYRELTLEQQDWDEPLPAHRETEWTKWTDSLSVLESLQIHRPFVPISLSHTQTRELCIFSDASTMAIAAVAYLRVVDTSGQCHVGFMIGKSKLAPSSAHTVPRLELCAAVLAVELAQIIIDESDIEFQKVNFYTDSKIVLGAVHIEVVESMSTSSFINALRRFLSVRGPIKHLRSDQGTNFIGACKELQINSEDPEIKDFLQDQTCTWTFNAPHSSHMGGVWERMIGLVRNILDGLLLKTSNTRLTHEVLVTLMAEVMAIMNARPLVPVTTDPETPEILSPAMLLTQKASPVLSPPGNFELKDLYKAQWRQVQGLADCFWKRWRQEYLATLQTRRKWTVEKPNVKEGDIVLLKDTQVKRNEWPVGMVVKAIPSDDKKTCSRLVFCDDAMRASWSLPLLPSPTLIT